MQCIPPCSVHCHLQVQLRVAAETRRAKAGDRGPSEQGRSERKDRTPSGQLAHTASRHRGHPSHGPQGQGKLCSRRPQLWRRRSWCKGPGTAGAWEAEEVKTSPVCPAEGRAGQVGMRSQRRALPPGWKPGRDSPQGAPRMLYKLESVQKILENPILGELKAATGLRWEGEGGGWKGPPGGGRLGSRVGGRRRFLVWRRRLQR